MKRVPDFPSDLSPERRELLELLLEEDEEGGSVLPVDCPPRRNTPSPLSSGQQRLWFFDQLKPGNVRFNQLQPLRLEGRLDVAVLWRSWREIVRRHEILRSGFVAIAGQPKRVIAPTPEAILPIVDVSQLGEELQQAEVRRLSLEQVHQSFDLAQPPLYRMVLVRIGAFSHVLLFSIHHIITDGWSNRVLREELASIYGALAKGKDSPLAALPIQYSDYVTWQQAWLQSEDAQRQREYWKQQLGGELPVLELPADRLRASDRSISRNASETFSLQKELYTRLKNFSRQHGLTLFVTLLTAFEVLLARYTGQDDVLVSVPIAGRNRAELEGLVGFFVNSLVLRTRLSGNPTFRELAGRVRETCFQAYSNQELPFNVVVAAVQPHRSTDQQPLTSVSFMLHRSITERLELTSELEVIPLAGEASNEFELTFLLWEGSEGLTGTVQYDPGLFEVETIRRLIGYFERLLGSVVSDPEQHIAKLGVLPQRERQQLLNAWNATEREYPDGFCLHERFEIQAEQTPDAIALTFPGTEAGEPAEQITYRELNRSANQLAHYLRSLGVEPEVLVGICMERSVEMVVGLLGILKAGGGYMPLDPSYPKERLAFMLEDAEARVLLTQNRLAQDLSVPAGSAEVVILDANREAIAQGPAGNPVNGVDPANLCYVIYTSGSTGQPKGCMNTHRGVCNRLLWMQDAYRLSATDRILQKTPFSFDVSVWEFFWPITTGAGLVVAKPGGHQDSAYLLNILTEQEITGLHFVPSMLHVFLEESGLESSTALGRVICSGEVLPVELQSRFFERMGCELHNLYGPTEAAIDVTSWQCQRGWARGAVPIGRPIANTSIYILDQGLEPVPVGVRGELYIGGVGLGRGYWKRPGLTAEKFIGNPFGRGRLYKTGDLARYLPDGNVEFLGRVDHQVKLRGFRIELGEVEAVLNSCVAVKQAAVTVRQQDGTGPKRLVAYLVGQGASASTEEVQDYSRRKLPDYMVPSAFVWMEKFPLTSNGKIDRSALPVPPTAASPTNDFIAPRTVVEKKLASIWEETLGLSRVGVYDDFFSVGGDSIVSVQIVTKAKLSGLHLTVNDIFRHRTIVGLANVVRSIPDRTANQGLITGAFALTPIQLWFFEQNLVDPHHFNQAVLLEVVQKTDATLLQHALRHLSLHHDALRMRFTQNGSGWQQFSASREELASLTTIDLSGLLGEVRIKALEQAVTHLQSSLDLTAGPVFRAALFERGDDESARLLMVAHHLVVDAVSWRILLEDLSTAYRQLGRGEAVQFAPKTMSFRQWSEEVVRYGQTETLHKEFEYWLSVAGAGEFRLPVDHPDALATNTVADARTISVLLSEKETELLLQEVPAAYNTQINDALLAAIAETLMQWTGSTTLLLDLEGHGRVSLSEETDVSRTVGWFTSLFPLVLALEKKAHPGSNLIAVKERLRSLPNAGVGFGVLRYLSRESGIREQLQALPRAEVVFNYLGRLDQNVLEGSPFRLTMNSTGLSQSKRQRRSHLLAINGYTMQGRLCVDWTYAGAVHRQATIQELAETFMNRLKEIIDHCTSRSARMYTPSDFPDASLSQEQLDKVLEELDLDTEEQG